jgi:hypothetical protein
MYATLDRPDVKQYREFYATPETIAALPKGDPIPSGTVLTTVQYNARLDARGRRPNETRSDSLRRAATGCSRAFR